MTDKDGQTNPPGAAPTGAIETVLYRVSGWLGVVSAVALCTMMAVTIVDVAGRKFFNSPIHGGYELIGMLLVCAGPLGMAFCEKDRGHITVSLVVDLFPPTVKTAFYAMGLFISFGLYFIITWRMFVLAVQYWSRGVGGLAPELGISFGWVAFVFAVGCLVFTLVLFLHLAQTMGKLVKGT